MASRGGGGTSVPQKGSYVPWLVLVVVTPLAAYLVHRLSSGTMCGWDYGGVGGACRAIILLSVLAGIVTGVLALFGARAFVADASSRAMVFGGLAVAVVVAATWFSGQFADYQRGMRGGIEMDEPMCVWVREKLPACIGEVWGPIEADTVRRAQPDCTADERSIADYARCMPLDDCKKIVDCITGH